MKFYFLRMIKAMQLQNDELKDFLLMNFKSFNLEWNKELLKYLKIYS